MQSASMLRGFLSVGLAVTLGCGGDEGPGGTGGAGTLQLVQTVPADLATEVSTDIVVTAKASMPR